jgi:Family of unknown function (DUF5681)
MAWKKGQSGNPSGRRKGTVLAQTAVRKMIEEAAPAIIAKQIEFAKKGNPFIAKFLLERIVPPAKSTPIAMPVELDGATPTQQAERVTHMLARGELTIEDGAALLSAIAATQAIKDSSELAERIKEIEQQLARLTAGGKPSESCEK